MKTMTVGEFKSRFSEALDAVRDGETIVVSYGFYRLPKVAHKDPFDCMLIWQCLQRQWTLITRDRGLDDYRAQA
jgi:PIN domain nuclease of toxin-antitoxin system